MRLHYGRMLADALDGTHGLPRPRLDDLVQRFPQILDDVRARRRIGEYGFYGLGEQTETVRAIRRFAEGVGQAFDHVLVLTTASIEAALRGVGTRPGTSPGTIVVPLLDTGKEAKASYELYLRVERLP